MKDMENRTSGETLTRREREKALHRQEILEAAEKVFADRGFECATVEEVARAAEFSVGALYKFFKSKEDLWMEVITRIGRDFLATFHRDVGSVADPLDAIRALIHLKLCHAQEHGAFLRVFMGSASGYKTVLSTINEQSCRCLYDEYIDEASLIIRKAMVSGRLRKADATYTLLTLEGLVRSAQSYWARRMMDVPLSEQARLVEQHFLEPLIINEGEE